MVLELKGADFDAYAPERTRATAMTAPRSAVKQRLVAWAHGVAQRLGSRPGADGIDLEVSATDEHPSARNGHRVVAQSAFLFRGSTARKAMQHALGRAVVTDEGRPEHGHARIELRIDASVVSLVLWLGGDARIDLEHAAAVLTHDDEEVLAAWEALPDDVAMEARAALSPHATLARDLPLREAARFAKDALESEVPLVIGVRLSRDEATRAHALDSWDEVADALARLLQALVWSPEGAAVVEARAAERPSRRGKRARPKPAPPPEPPPPPAAKQAIDRGSHVRALAGPFAGQAGVVQELDGKGGARVLFGLLAARVELRDLTVADKKRGRPVLSSSHRKPTQ